MKNSSIKRHGLNRRQLSILPPSWPALRCCRLGRFPVSAPPALPPATHRSGPDDTGQDRHQTQPAGLWTAATADGSKPPSVGMVFNKLIHYAYDQGITTLTRRNPTALLSGSVTRSKDCRAKNFLFSPRWTAKPADVLAVIDHHRKVFNTDYIDSLLVHCMTRGNGPTNGSASWMVSARPGRRNGFARRAFPATRCPRCAPPLPAIGPRCSWRA